MLQRFSFFSWLVVSVVLACGCGDGEPPAPTPDASVADRGAPGDASSELHDAQAEADQRPLGGFGARCSDAAPCSTGLRCFRFAADASTGFCSRPCDNVGKACAGDGDGTRPYCVLADGGEHFCGFVCKIAHQGHEHDYPCPSELTCNPEIIPPATSSYLCIP